MAQAKLRDKPGAAAIYCRLSDDRTGSAAGVRRQQEDCQKLAQRRGWPIAQIYVDNDVSAYSGATRPEYQRLLADIGSGAVDAVVTWHPDRLHRRPIELEQFFEVCDRAGLRHLASVAGDYDLASDDARLQARIMGAVARKSSDDMARRLRRKHEELAKLGKLSGGGSRPFGYEDDRITLRLSEAALIRSAVRRVLAGESMNSIVNEWNRAGTRTSYGKVWDVSGLRQVLTSARISGRREHHGEVVSDTAAWKGIISAADSDRLRTTLGPARGRRTGPPTRFLLTGFLRCGRCGVALAGSRAPTRVAERATAGRYATLSYACAHHARNRPTACGGIRVRATPLESHVMEMVFEALDSPKLAARLAEKRRGGKRESAFDSVAQIETDLRELARDFGEARVTRAEWMAARVPLERRLGAAQQQLSAEQGTSALNGLGQPGQLRKAWTGQNAEGEAVLSLDRKRAILAVVVDHITIKPANPAVARNRFDASRVEVVWRA